MQAFCASAPHPEVVSCSARPSCFTIISITATVVAATVLVVLSSDPCEAAAVRRQVEKFVELYVCGHLDISTTCLNKIQKMCQNINTYVNIYLRTNRHFY